MGALDFDTLALAEIAWQEPRQRLSCDLVSMQALVQDILGEVGYCRLATGCRKHLAPQKTHHPGEQQCHLV